MQSLTSGACLRHPLGGNKGKHELYEGSEKSRYHCKYCGNAYSSIAILTAGACLRHPHGGNKGKHSPAL
ncbi:MAG: hypothetical protein EAZ81_13465 [Verrucomicrobia bacterium]|nr:MAG: hypothetical protein EAZ81_13465 [Verrucomicrobiota bacterium]